MAYCRTGPFVQYVDNSADAVVAVWFVPAVMKYQLTAVPAFPRGCARAKETARDRKTRRIFILFSSLIPPPPRASYHTLMNFRCAM